MTTPLTYTELRELSDEELIRRHDHATKHVSVGLNYFSEELARRRAERQGDTLERISRTIESLTKWIAGLTALTTLATIANLFILLLDGADPGS